MRGLLFSLLLSYLPAAEPIEILSEQPVKIATSSSPTIFPKSWRSGSVQAHGLALPSERREEALRVIKAALLKYPQVVLREHLGAVYVLGELGYRGVFTSGTNSALDVYLKFGSEKRGFTSQHLEGVFHAEFSSILIRNRPEFLDSKAWHAANPPGFSYLGDGVDAVKQGKASTRPTESFYEQGFLSQYGQSTLENDFNGFAQRLWTHDPELWRLAKQHPALQTKLQLALHFYQKLHPLLSEAFFKTLPPQ